VHSNVVEDQRDVNANGEQQLNHEAQFWGLVGFLWSGHNLSTFDKMSMKLSISQDLEVPKY